MLDIDVIAIGRMTDSAMAEVAESYYSRIRWPLKMHEIKSRKQDKRERHKEETTKIHDKLDSHALIIVLDERGYDLQSLKFANQLREWRDTGEKSVQFIIGGAEGLSDDIRNKANLVLRFGQQTWPHLLVRIMLLEQIYRAQTILDGHPYHK